MVEIPWCWWLRGENPDWCRAFWYRFSVLFDVRDKYPKRVVVEEISKGLV